MPNDKAHSHEHPSFRPEAELWELTMGLELPSGATLTHDMYGHRVIRIDEGVPYPQASDFSQEGIAKQILLDPVPSIPGRYSVPENSTTLVTILNEAAGATDSFDVAPDESRTLGLLNGIFTSLAVNLQELAEVDQAVPRQLSYNQVLVMKDEYRCKLLPPLTFERVQSPSELSAAWSRMVHSLLRSLNENADTQSQRSLVRSLQGPLREIFGRKLA